jgi:hypothetical protein
MAPLACLLFDMSLRKVTRDAELETGGTIFSKYVQILDYVGSVVIIEVSLTVVKETFISVEEATEEMGLTVNENKTKFMTQNDANYYDLI